MKTVRGGVLLMTVLIVSGGDYVNSASEITDYYWREYTGAVPGDAIRAGTDKSGKPIYVGQGFFKNIGLLPTTIYENSKTIKVTALGNVYVSDKNTKILCSRNPNKYRWVPIKIDDLQLLTNCHLVVGGTETETTLYIGRANHEMELQVGKVYPSFSPYKGLAIPHNGKQATYTSFEVLTYDCNPKKFCDDLDVFAIN